MAVRITSWDCGYTTLAYICATIDTQIYQKVRHQLNLIKQTITCNQISQKQLTKQIIELDSILAGFITIHAYNVCDVLGGRKVKITTEVDRAIALHTFLNEARDAAIFNHADRIIIEHQAPIVGKFGATNNSQVPTVAKQLVYHHVSKGTRDICMISSKLKDKMQLDPKISLANFPKNPNAKKKYAVANMRTFCQNWHLQIN